MPGMEQSARLSRGTAASFPGARASNLRGHAPYDLNVTARRLRIAAAAVALVGVGAIAAAGVLLGFGDDQRETEARPPEPVSAPDAGAAVPSLRGTDPVSGKRVSLTQFEGRPVVVHIWASWCADCAAEAEDIRRFAAKHPRVGVLGIDFQDTPAGAKAFYERWDWTHPSIFDADGELAVRLGLVELPTTIFLDRSHREVARLVGAADLEALNEAFIQAGASD